MQLQLSCVYEPRLAGGAGRALCETFPLRLHVHGTHELRRETPAVFRFGAELADAEQRPLAARAADFRFDVALEWRGVAQLADLWAPLHALGAYRFAEVGRQFEPYRISRSARVVFGAYARTANPEGQACWVRVGSTSFTVAQLRGVLDGTPLRCAMRQNEIDVDPRAPRQRDTVRVDEPLLKGSVAILRAALVGGTRADFEAALLPEQPAFDIASNDQMRSQSLEMNAVINRVMATFFGPQAVLKTPSISPLIRFHAPVSLRDLLVLPSLGYPLLRSPQPATLEYYAGVARIVCWRRGLTPTELNATAARLFGAGALPRRAEACALYSFCGAMLSLLSTALVYVEDFANRNQAGVAWRDALVEGDEDNKVARTCRGDDCEGLALEALMHAMELFVDGDRITAGAGTSPFDELVRNVVRVLRLYVPGNLFGAVTDTKMTYGSATSLTRANTLAHTYCGLVPFDQFDAAQSAETRTALGATARYRAYDAQRGLLARLSLPVLIAEGTALVDATMLPVDSYYGAGEEADLAAAVAICTLRTRMADQVHARVDAVRLQTEMLACERLDAALVDNRRDLSSFYKWINGFTTPVFAEARLLDFAFHYTYDGRPPVLTYGVRSNDVLLRDATGHQPSAGRSPAIGIAPTVRLTAREAAVVDNILALDEPVPRLLAPSDDAPLGGDAARAAVARLVGRRRAPMAQTAMHRARMLVSGRVEDIGSAEVAALESLAAMHDWAEVTAAWHRVAEFNLPHLEPISVLDVVFHY